MSKRVVVPYAGAKNVTLFDEQYDVVDGRIEVSDEVAQQVLEHADLNVNVGGGAKWLVEEIAEVEESEEDDSPVNVGKGKAKK